MDQESDHPNSDESGAAAVTSVGSDVSQLEERVRVLVTEHDQFAADLAQAKSAIEASESELASSREKIQELTAFEASERQLAAVQGKIQELTSEKDQLTGQIAQARSAVETTERELAAATSRVRELAKEKDELVADITRVQAEANKVGDTLRALDSESFFGFIRRRYFGKN
jgi:chromosome segregation ATPase